MLLLKSLKTQGPMILVMVTNYRQVEKKILERILSADIYDSQIRPLALGTVFNKSDSDESTKVLVNMFVHSFEKVDDVKMEFSIQITFRQKWNDNRLEFNDMGGEIKYLSMTERSKVWMPDTFFRNEKEAKFHEIIQLNLYVKFFPDGDVLYSIRVSVTSETINSITFQTAGLPYSGLPNEPEYVPPGHPDLPPHHC